MAGPEAPQRCVLLPEALRPFSQHRDNKAPCFLCSYVKSVLDGKKKSILLTCFNSVFLLPTHEHLEGPSRIQYLEVCSGGALATPTPLG